MRAGFHILVIWLALSLGGPQFARPAMAQSAYSPPHKAGEVVHQGPNFTIHTLSIVPIRPNEYCGGGRYPALNLQVVFDVDDDFQLDETFLETALPYALVRGIADEICPDAVIITTSHFFKDRFIGPYKEISDRETVSRSRSEMAFSTLNYAADQGNQPVYSNRLRIDGRSWNDVVAFNAAGQKTEDQIAFERAREKERQTYQAQSDAIGRVRDDYFTAKKAALKWPAGDTWMFDVYVRGGTGEPVPPARSPEQEGALGLYPSRDGMLLAYVEEAQRQCGAVSPNGTAEIGFTLTDQQSGAVTASESYPVDVKLYEAYRAAKLSTGAYNIFSLSNIKRYQGDLKRLFGLWPCDGPQFGRFIDGILKTEDG